MNSATLKGASRIQSVVGSIHDIVQGIRVIVSELSEMDEKVKKEMLLIKTVLNQTTEMQNMSGKLKSTSIEQGNFSRDILENIQTIHERSRKILQTAGALQDNTELLNHITERLNQNISS
jgi:methyl-accepting chemotaxis protein